MNNTTIGALLIQLESLGVRDAESIKSIAPELYQAVSHPLILPWGTSYNDFKAELHNRAEFLESLLTQEN